MSQRSRLVLDAGALIDIETDPRGETFRSCVKAFDDGYRPYLPTVVLAQVWRNRARQHPARMMRRLCALLSFTEQTGEDVGRLLARSGTSDVVDAAVIVAAIEHNAAVLTSDPKDLGKLASAAEYPVRLLTV
ncbi:MAG: PIN domain-containing protein [Pseudonocardiaceae bacterium]